MISEAVRQTFANGQRRILYFCCEACTAVIEPEQNVLMEKCSLCGSEDIYVSFEPATRPKGETQ